MTNTWLWVAALGALLVATVFRETRLGRFAVATRDDEIAAAGHRDRPVLAALDGLGGQHRHRRRWPVRCACRRSAAPTRSSTRSTSACWCWRCSSPAGCAPSPAPSSGPSCHGRQRGVPPARRRPRRSSDCPTCSSASCCWPSCCCARAGCSATPTSPGGCASGRGAGVRGSRPPERGRHTPGCVEALGWRCGGRRGPGRRRGDHRALRRVRGARRCRRAGAARRGRRADRPQRGRQDDAVQRRHRHRGRGGGHRHAR